MNSIKYRKLYLSENHGFNNFIIIKEKVVLPCCCLLCPYSVNFQRDNPRVLSGEAYWIDYNQLCIGYISSKNSDIFRPVFSYKRQKILDKVNSDIINPYNFWKNVISKYFKTLYGKKNIPTECINHILKYIH